MIDFHCHLDLYPNPKQVVRECVARGVHVLCVTTTPTAWRGTSTLVSDTNRIRVALGLHPQLAYERKSELPLFDELVVDAQYVGEIGLDGTPELRKFWPDQTYVFEHILSTCQAAGGRIMTIHSRRAVKEVLDRLEAHSHAGIPILHWYSGNHRDLARAIELGCWFSVGPAMLAGEKGRQLVSQMPRDRILTETDGPFAVLDNRMLSPWDVDQALAALASIWVRDKDDVETIINENLSRLALFKHKPELRQSVKSGAEDGQEEVGAKSLE
jgi:TatD DNase family protein